MNLLYVLFVAIFLASLARGHVRDALKERQQRKAHLRSRLWYIKHFEGEMLELRQVKVRRQV
jgi:hypothetical protein